MGIREDIYSHWRKQMFIICCIFISIGTLLEVVIYAYDSSTKVLFLPEQLYRLRFIYIPVALNLGMLLLTYALLKHPSLSPSWKNISSCMLIYFICANIQVVHYVYSPLFVLPILSIFVSVLFADKRLTLFLTLVSWLSLGGAGYLGSIELRKDDPLLYSDLFIAFIVILVSSISAQLIIQYISQQINYILSVSAREKELLEALRIDALMNIGNRAALYDYLLEFPMNYSWDTNYFLLLFDVDDFKKINNSYGHIAGDEVLSAFGKIINEFGSDGIDAYRFGGDEVVIVLKGMEKEEAFIFGETLRHEFEELSFSFLHNHPLTISGGLAAYKPGWVDEDWINAAHKALQESKRQGKNQIQMAP